MRTMASQEVSNPVRMGAAGALGAVTLLWLGTMSPAFFQAGTVLLVVSLIPLARGLGARGGAMVGLLLSVVWIAARLGFAGRLDLSTVVNEVNVIIVAATMTIGGLAGVLLEGGAAGGKMVDFAKPQAAEGNATSPLARSIASTEFESTWREALVRHREWMAGWDQAGYPWTSFDNHIRELVRLLTGLQRLRCYRISESGELHPMSSEHQTEPVNASSNGLMTHVVTTGRRFIAGTPSAGPLVQELAGAGASPLAWAVPIRDRNVSIGLMTAEGAGRPGSEAQLQMVADLVEELWLHVHHLDLLRVARHTDRGSGLINRTDFLGSLKATLEQCYQLNEPVVVMVVCLEGLRGLDDASQWAKRDELIEAVGQTIANGIRKDDVVGRFSDAQFVALLRRLDLSLAELICRKLLGSMAKVIADFELGSWVTPRAGLSGSGFARPDAEALLRQAISALQRARTQDLLLVSEPLERPKGAGAP